MSANHRQRSRRSSGQHDTGLPGDEAGAWIAVGEIVGVFGLHGEVRVLPQTDFPERFAQTPTLYLGDARAPFAVENARQQQRMVILKLAGVDDAVAAQRLRGMTLWIPAAERMPLEADQFYLHDVVGLRVEHVNGQPLGTVVDFITGGGNDLFVIRATPSGREVLLPAVREFVRELDIPGGVLRVSPIPGLFDEQAEIAADSNNPDALVRADEIGGTDETDETDESGA